MMAYSFTDEFLTQLRNRCDIEDIIGRYVNLKKTGSSTVGLCPFHSERTPSFHVSGRKQMFYCFGCHKGGDVITFIMEAEHLPYVDAVVFLANMVGLPVPQKNVFDTEIAELRKRILEINRAAARFYFDTLFKPEGKAGLEYFKNRKLTPTTVRRFGLGYAPDSWDSLLKHLLDKGYALDDIKAAGLAIQSKTGGKHFDRFRSRCMFPIIDHRGNVIGFGGRTMDANNPAKYLNSSENLVFKKGQNLFALNIAKNTKETCLILCEGYMDVISLHQAGFDNAVASLGTALTPDQARLIRRYTENVVVCYDSDAAGKKATQRALEILPPAGLNVRVMTVTGGKDPDDMMKEEGGKEKFRRLLDASFNSVDYRFSETLAKYDISVDTEKIECLKKMAEIIAPIPSPAERDVYASKIAEIMTVDKKAVVAEINQRRKRMQRFREKEERAKQLSSLTDANDKVNPQRPRHLKAAKAEEDLAALRDEYFKVAILRPPMIYGKDCKGNYQTLSKLAKKLPVFPLVENQRSMLYIDNLCEFIRLLVEDGADGLYCPQNAEYVSTSDMVSRIAHAHGRGILMVRGLGWALKLLAPMTGMVDKAFGSLCYDRALSDYTKSYCVKTFDESILETEGVSQ